jgi:predicted RNase H-like nuclease (RuvC/YqgF family)
MTEVQYLREIENLEAQKENDMSEIHRDRELEHLESMLYTYKVENKSMDAENERLKQEIRRLLEEIARLEHEKRSAALDWMTAAKQYEDEIERLRAALEGAAVQFANNNLPAFSHQCRAALEEK